MSLYGSESASISCIHTSPLLLIDSIMLHACMLIINFVSAIVNNSEQPLHIIVITVLLLILNTSYHFHDLNYS